MTDVNNRIPVIGIRRLRFGTEGTGIRTLIATYGCPLKCRYCLNPQSWDEGYVPRFMTIEEIYETISIDNLYFLTTNGGITIGGGEPLLHMEKLKGLLEMCPKGWNNYIETSLNADTKSVLAAASFFNHFIVDIKTLNQEVYEEYTSGDMNIAFDNLCVLLQTVGPSRINVRVPEIPGYANQAMQDETIKKLKSIGIEHFDVFKYMMVK